MTASNVDVAPHIVRVSISIPGLNIDVPLPSNIPIDLVIADLIPFLRQTLVNQDLPTTWIDQLVRWKLTTKFGHRLAPTKTLDEVGVLHGDMLLVEVEKTAEQFTPLIDDVADAVATIQSRTYPDYSPHHSVKIISIALVLLASFSSLLLGIYAQTHREGLARWTSVVMISFGFFMLISSWILIKKNKQAKDETPYPALVTGSLIMSSLIWIGAGVLTVVPRPLGAPQILMTSMAILGLTSLSARITLDHPLLHGTVMVPSLLFAIAAALQIIFPQHIGTLGAEIALLAIIVVFLTTKVSLMMAKISLPPTPAPGEEHVKDNAIITVGELIATEDTKHDGVLPTVADDEEKRAIRQYVLSNAFLLGAVITLTISSFLAADITAPNFWCIIIFLWVLSGILIFRGKSYSDMFNRGILYVGSIAILFAAWIHLVIEDKQPEHIIYYTSALFLAFMAFFIGIVQGKTLDSPIQRQRVEIIERILYASLFPLVTVISGLYFKARYHS